MSTLYKTATNITNGSTAASSDAPGGAKTGTAKPGDTLKWVVSYQNNTAATASVNLKDPFPSAGTYVPGSLQLPPNPNAAGALTPQYSTNQGATWTAGTPPSNADGVGFTGTGIPQGTAQRSVTIPSPISTSLSNSGGDGYNAVTRGNLTYAAFHHQGGSYLYCGQQDGSTCPGWPTNQNNQYYSRVVGTPIGTGTDAGLTTAWQNGTWISGSKLFWYATTIASPFSTGVACLDLSFATPQSCGFTQLGSGGNSNENGGQIGGMGVPASNGNMYALTVSAGSALILCITASTGANCGTLTLATGVTGIHTLSSSTFGSYIFANFQQTPTSRWQTYCYVAGGGLCAGSWPITTSSDSTPYGPPALAPILNTAGAMTGVCVIQNGSGYTTGCYNLAGTAIANPYGSSLAYTGSGYGALDALILGSKVYSSTGNAVGCFDFGSWSGTGAVPTCAGFTPPSNSINYTVRTAYSIAPNCLVADGDGRQIKFFNAFTGGGCVGVSGPTTMTVSPSSYYCGTGASSFKAWGVLTIPGLVNGTYTNSTVTLRDQNNAIITGFNAVTLAAGGSLNLSATPTTVTSITATVTVNGVNDPSGVVAGQVQITWQGDPLQMCFQTRAPSVACDAATPLTLSNTANAVTTSASGSDAPNGNTTGAAQFSDRASLLPGDSQCALVFQKVPSVQTARPGDKVTYTINVISAGTQAYNNATFSDDLTDVLKDATYNNDQSATSGTASYAAPTLSWSGPVAGFGGIATITYSVTVKSPDTGDHSLVNTVVSSTPGSFCTSGSTDTRCTATVPIADLTVTKTADAAAVTNPAKVGDIITYHFTAKNTGQTTLTGVAITDPHVGLSALTYTWPGTAGTLLAGQTVTATATYALTQADINSGVVANTATAAGNPPTGPPLITPPANASVPLQQAPAMSLTKTANSSGVSSPAKVGDIVVYTFKATNTGNVTLTGVSISDPHVGLSALTYTWPGVAGTLLPGQAVTATATYAITQADINAGHVPNTATATGNPPSGPNVTPPPASADVPLTQGPGLSLTKTADTSGVSVPASVGQTIVYHFNATNTGNVTLTKVSISDPLPGLSPLVYSWPGASGVLLPNQHVTATATYQLTVADVDAGHVANAATTVGTPPSGPDVIPPPAQTDTPLVSSPAISIVKSADSIDAALLVVGATITYTFVVTNTGNVTLADPKVNEGQFTGSGALSPLSCPSTPQLQPGEQMTCTATYVVTQADVDAGVILNDATASGTPPTGPDTVSPPSAVDLPEIQSPDLNLTKTADTFQLSAPASAGDTITYNFISTNTGNVTLTNVSITDPLPGLSGLVYSWPAAPGVLLPGQHVTATATYQLTQADLDAGHVANVATTVGTPPSGADVTPPPATTDTPLPLSPGLTLAKTADASAIGTPSAVGDTITYRFAATNTGNVTLTNVSITDPLPGLSALTYVWPAAAGTLLPGQVVTATATYQLSQADLDAG
ncbi:MAG: DUF7507 domain-containing protein, partial [Leifsonia sp.]